MNNPDYNETIAAARLLGIPVNSPSQNDDAVRSLVDKLRSETSINEAKEMAKIRTEERTSQHTLWGKTLANIAAYLIAFVMFTLGGLLLYRDRPGDADRAKWLIGLSTTVIFGNAGARGLRSLTAKDD